MSTVLPFRSSDSWWLRFYFAFRRCLGGPLAALVGTEPALFQAGHLVDVGVDSGYSASLLSKAVSNGFRVFAVGAGSVEPVDRLLAVASATSPVAAIHIDAGGQALAVCKSAEFTLAANPQCAVILHYRPKALAAAGVEEGELPRWFTRRGYRIQKAGWMGRLSAVDHNLGSACLLFRRR